MQIWSIPHVFYEGALAATGVKNLYFPASDVNALIDIILSHYPDINPRLLVPAPDKFFPLSAFSTSPTPIRFKTVDALQMHRAGTQLSQDTPIFQQNKAVFEQMRKEGKGTIIAVDVESWEEDHTIVIEIGWSYLAWRTSTISGKTQEVSAVKHFIIDEHRQFRNGQYSPDNRDYFSFGRSETTSLKATLKQLQDFLDDSKAKGPVLMVFHNASAEKEYFANLRIDTKDWIEGFEPLPPIKNKDVEELLIDLSVGDASTSSAGDANKAHTLVKDGYVYIQDTQKLYAGSGLPGAIKQIGLQNALNKLDIPSRKMHNAGNDAHCEQPSFVLSFRTVKLVVDRI
jgi:hypothetical protein